MMPSDIRTLDEPHRGAGTVAEVRGGGDMVIAIADPQTEAEWEEAFEFNGVAEPDITTQTGDSIGFSYA